MPRLTRQEIVEREAFVKDRWKALWPRGPDAPTKNLPTAAKINELLHKRFQEQMRSDKVYRLRDVAIKELREEGHEVPNPMRKPRKGGTPSPAQAPVVHAGRKGKAPVAQPPKATPVAVRATLPHILSGLRPGEPQIIARVLAELGNIGVINVRVEHQGDDYVVINAAH
jgi:hypothetical protein